MPTGVAKTAVTRSLTVVSAPSRPSRLVCAWLFLLCLCVFVVFVAGADSLLIGRRRRGRERIDLAGLRCGRRRPDGLDPPAVLVRVVVANAHHLGDAAGSFGRSRPVNDSRDAVDNAAADDRPRQGVTRLHGAGRQARERRRRGIRVHGGQRAAVPGVEGLQQIGDLGTPDLADDDVIGPVAQGVPDQIPDRHPLVAEPARLEAQAIGTLKVQLQGVFDGDDTALGGSSATSAFRSVVLPEPVPPRDQDVAPATWARGWIDNSSD